MAGGNVSFTIPVTVNAPTASGTYLATVALGRGGPDGDADPYNNDYNTSNDTATAQLVLALSADVSVIKTNPATTLMGGQETVYAIVVMTKLTGAGFGNRLKCAPGRRDSRLFRMLGPSWA